MRGLPLTWIWAGLALFGLLFFLGVYGQLPPVVATHFDAVGNPNGYQTKSAFIAVFLPVMLLPNGLFALFYFLADRVPAERMNLPHKAEWLSTPQNRALLLGKLRGSLVETALFLNLALLFAVQAIYQQNVPGAAFHMPFLAGLVLILGGALVLAVRSLFIFRRPPQDPQ
ncbi:MAG TPA: DUF1648 domain-containing protein [bacterium]|nr:DUF1648 domain-containing protein [bacterium]